MLLRTMCRCIQTCISASASKGSHTLQIQREIKLHARLQHENIISLYAAFQDSEGICLILVQPVHVTAHNIAFASLLG